MPVFRQQSWLTHVFPGTQRMVTQESCIKNVKKSCTGMQWMPHIHVYLHTHKTKRWRDLVSSINDTAQISFRQSICKPRSGRSFVLNSCAWKSIAKAKYKQNNLTRNFLVKLPRIWTAKNIEVSSITGGGTWLGKDGRLSSEPKYLCWTKAAKESPFEIRQKMREADSRRLE